MGFFDGFFEADANRRANQKAAMDAQEQQLRLRALQQQAVNNAQIAQVIHADQARGADPATTLTDAGLAELAQGNISAGSQALNTANRIRHDADTIRQKYTDSTFRTLTAVGNAYATVHDQASWVAANQALIQAGINVPWATTIGPDGKSRLADYNPETVAAVRAMTTKAKDDATTALAKVRLEKVEEDIRRSKIQAKKVEAETKLIEDRDAELAKHGGKPPSAGLVRALVDRITADYGDDKVGSNAPDSAVGHADINNKARVLAEQVQDLMRDSPNSITQSQAVEQVYARARRENSFAGWRTNAQVKGETPERPLPMPTGSTADISKRLEVNRWYDTKQGPGLWNGTEFLTREEVEKSQREESTASGGPKAAIVESIEVVDSSGTPTTISRDAEGNWVDADGNEIDPQDFRRAE